MILSYVQTQKINDIYAYLTELFGETPHCELKFKTDIDLLVAIILSAQCTDKRVNMVTENLFKKYKTPNDYANADIKEFEKEIYSTGFYRNKAKNIIAMAKSIVNNHGGKIPRDLETLTNLSGVGRKTASVFLVEFCGIPAVPVDTHIMRIAHRLGLSSGKTPAQIERDLRQIWDEKNWCKYHLQTVLFGRYYCLAKNPKCENCKIRGLCEYKK